MLKLLSGMLLVLALAIGPAWAQTDADTDAAIDDVLGDHEAYYGVFDAIQTAVAVDDRAALAELVSYPIDVTIDGKQVTIEDATQFVDRYDEIMTDEIMEAITLQLWAQVMVSDQGVMFGNGEVWISGICGDDACEQFDVKIITIQPTSN